MKSTMLYVLPFVTSLISTNAFSAIDADADIVALRSSCTVNSVSINNCFEDTPSLISWIENTRSPVANAAAPLQVNIGPGTFGLFQLKNDVAGCHLSLVGSGRQQTKITNTFGPSAFQFPSHCVLSISDLTIENTGLLWAINVTGGTAGLPGGETTWTDVDVIAQYYGWQGGGTCDTKHSWFNSRIITRSAAFGGQTVARAYTTCAEDWFYGSEITAISKTGGASPDEMFAIQANNGAEVHVYGSIVRTITETGVIAKAGDVTLQHKKGVVAIQSLGNSVIHIHGTAIDMLSEEGNDVVVLAVMGGGRIHANETSYNLRTGSGGTMTRLMDAGGVLRTPAVWESSSTLPNVVSITGQDSAIYTGTASGRPHHVVYDSTCANSWFDTTSNNCL